MVLPNQQAYPGSPKSTVELSADQASTLLKLLDVLDDNDDVQSTLRILRLVTMFWKSSRSKLC